MDGKRKLFIMTESVSSAAQFTPKMINWNYTTLAIFLPFVLFLSNSTVLFKHELVNTDMYPIFSSPFPVIYYTFCKTFFNLKSCVANEIIN